MRLHRLEIEAFGPFADRTVVDFDALSAAGLFLLSGATGAGKTSVLDAVCFALYGDVPGERGAAKQLRCDQAAPGAAPRVGLEVTLGERRFRFSRSPAWDRPKKRGTGLTPQQASVTVSELRGGSWTPVSSRIDETGDLVARLTGMNLTQFTQVALLPQGRFQTFLRARSEERHQLLQQLFRTGRFAEVERWLRERRLGLARADAEAHQRVADVVSRISETTGLALPDGWDAHDLRPVADEHGLSPWADGLLADTAERHDRCTAAAARSTQRETAARRALELARAEAERRSRHAAARLELGELEACATAHAHDLRRLAAARRAAAVVPHHRHAVARGAEAEATGLRARASLERLARHLHVGEPPTDEVLAGLVDGAVTTAAAARAVLPRVRRGDRCRSELDALGRRLRTTDEELATATATLEHLPERLEAHRREVAAAEAAQQRLPGLTAREELLAERAAAHEEVTRLVALVEDTRVEWLAAREEALLLREALLDLQQARIEGMAAELAGALASGCSCPVCGSAEHPAKAASAPGAPDARTERAARGRADDASVVEHAFAAKLHELETGLAAARARTGDTTLPALRAELAEVRQQRREVAGTAAGQPAAATALRDAELEHRRLLAEASGLEADRARLLAEQDALTDEVAEVEAEVAALLDGTLHDDLDALVADAELTASLCREAHAALEESRRATAARTDSIAAAARAAEEAGFADLPDALAAVLAPAEVDALHATTEHHRQRLAAVREVLAEPGADTGAPDPDVDALEAAHAEALAARDGDTTALHVATSTHERLSLLVGLLGQELGPWSTLRAELGLTTTLASFVEGKSADNRLRMRLSAYVLAYRLGQVVAAANERLARMSDQRYSLEHTGRRGTGETRGGLSLLVRDDWSGESRDPATLSGGETFVVSLALALGLSDVVVGESGGAALDTLFVDEGFGSLDADTLDDVMDTLDSLRDGGRVVGLVSHVAEMRDRIPTQLVVTKARGGSSVRLRGC